VGLLNVRFTPESGHQLAADLMSMNSDSSGSATAGMPTPIIPFRRPATRPAAWRYSLRLNRQ
jgi:hypothetical protein